jgi:hypothetical protein
MRAWTLAVSGNACIGVAAISVLSPRVVPCVEGEMNKLINTAENSWVDANDHLRCNRASMPEQTDVSTEHDHVS